MTLCTSNLLLVELELESESRSETEIAFHRANIDIFMLSVAQNEFFFILFIQFNFFFLVNAFPHRVL